jgi:hypothetical protein
MEQMGVAVVHERDPEIPARRRPMRSPLCLALSLLIPGALAERAVAQPAPPTQEGGGGFRLSFMVAPAPGVSVQSPIDSFAGAGQGQHTVALAPALDYALGESWFVGLNPQYVVWIRGPSATGPVVGSEIDVRGRIGAQARSFDRLSVFGYLAPGYSVILPSPDLGRMNKPRGPVVAGALGMALDVRPTVAFSMELGEQYGFQTGKKDGSRVDYRTHFLYIALGLRLQLS